MFTRFRMECPTRAILCYFIFYVPDLNDEVGEWHCYRWNISLKYALCYIHQREEKDFTDDQHCYLRKAFSKHFWCFHRILANWELCYPRDQKEGHKLHKYDLEYILNSFAHSAWTLKVIPCGLLPSSYIHC